jgi:hypothetical protein
MLPARLDVGGSGTSWTLHAIAIDGNRVLLNERRQQFAPGEVAGMVQSGRDESDIGRPDRYPFLFLGGAGRGVEHAAFAVSGSDREIWR